MAIWTDLSGVFGTQEQLTSTQCQQLRDNTTAAFEKAAGAPQLANDYIVNDMVSDDSVKSKQVKEDSIATIHMQKRSATTLKLSGDVIAYLWAFE